MYVQKAVTSHRTPNLRALLSMQKQWTVKPEESGMRLQAFLKAQLSEQFSARQIKQLIENNRCSINNRTERFASASVGIGDNISLQFDEAYPTPTQIQFDRSKILFEDEALLIYNKPAGTASDSEQFLRIIKQNTPFLALVHRLDKETSGALIFAKSDNIFNQMKELFKNRLINKTYYAVVDGIPKKHSGVISNFLGEINRYQGQVIIGSVPKGLEAITEWECVAKGSEATLMRCQPKTGRTHQIRVHLSEMGHPILGDHQYGKDFKCLLRPSRYLLHAFALTFKHPTKNQQIQVHAPLPPDFLNAMHQLNIYCSIK